MNLRTFVAIILAVFVTASISTVHAQSCCDKKGEGMSELKDGAKIKKDVRVIKEKNDGAEVVKVTVKTTKDGKTEEQVLEGDAAAKYITAMEEECGDDCCEGHKEGTEVKKIIKKKIEKKSSEGKDLK